MWLSCHPTASSWTNQCLSASTSTLQCPYLCVSCLVWRGLAAMTAQWWADCGRTQYYRGNSFESLRLDLDYQRNLTAPMLESMTVTLARCPFLSAATPSRNHHHYWYSASVFGHFQANQDWNFYLDRWLQRRYYAQCWVYWAGKCQFPNVQGRKVGISPWSRCCSLFDNFLASSHLRSCL